MTRLAVLQELQKIADYMDDHGMHVQASTVDDVMVRVALFDDLWDKFKMPLNPFQNAYDTAFGKQYVAPLPHTSYYSNAPDYQAVKMPTLKPGMTPAEFAIRNRQTMLNSGLMKLLQQEKQYALEYHKQRLTNKWNAETLHNIQRQYVSILQSQGQTAPMAIQNAKNAPRHVMVQTIIQEQLKAVAEQIDQTQLSDQSSLNTADLLNNMNDMTGLNGV